MAADFEWGGVLLACGLLALMFVVPTVVLIRDTRRKDREARAEQERERAAVFSGDTRRGRSTDGEL